MPEKRQHQLQEQQQRLLAENTQGANIAIATNGDLPIC